MSQDLQSDVSEGSDNASIGFDKDDRDDDDDDDDNDDDDDDGGGHNELATGDANLQPRLSYLENRSSSRSGNTLLRQEEARVLAIEGRVDELDEEEQVELATRNSVRHQRGREKVQGG